MEITLNSIEVQNEKDALIFLDKNKYGQKPKLNILCTGSRDWTDRKLVKSVLSAYKSYDVTVIQGTSKGLDAIADEVANELGMKGIGFSANQKYDARDLLLRNTVMVNKLEPSRDLVLAFRTSRLSKGTNDAVQKAVGRGLRVIMYTLDDKYPGGIKCSDFNLSTGADLPMVENPEITE
uniref:YspA cpYpsA-related SLOG domain-containing protein n=1 Tax=Bacillus phage Adastra TaxID=3143958 RepID=A0AAU8BCU7_9CAUD